MSFSIQGKTVIVTGASWPVDVVGLIDRWFVAWDGIYGAFVLNTMGEVTHHLRSPLPDSAVTNVACWPGRDVIVMTESMSGSILVAALPPP